MGITHEDPLFLLEEELEWHHQMKQLPKSDYDWLQVFPEAKPKVLKNLKEQKKFLTDAERNELVFIQDQKNEMGGKPPHEHADHEFMIGLAEKRVNKIQAELKRISWQISALEGRSDSATGITEDDKNMARAIPIINFVEHKRVGNKYLVKCIFHNDSRPSLTIFPDNRFKCFSCGAHGDSIDFIKQLNGVEFLDAVRWMLNK